MLSIELINFTKLMINLDPALANPLGDRLVYRNQESVSKLCIKHLSNQKLVEPSDPPFAREERVSITKCNSQKFCTRKKRNVSWRWIASIEVNLLFLFLSLYSEWRSKDLFSGGWDEWAHTASPQLRFLVRSFSCFLRPRSFEYLTPELARNIC